MNINQYFNRINYKGQTAPTLETLQVLQKAHLLHIPFENLDIHSSTPIVLDTEKIFNKVVLNNRGGFCYELNGLFHALLIQLGYDVQMISGRVFNKEKGYGPEFDHLALLVRIDNQQYLTDVGFGEFVFYPLRFELNRIQEDERGLFVIEAFKDDYFIIYKIEEGEQSPQYIFNTTKRAYQDFEKMCHYHQSNPASHFTHKTFLGIPIVNGRITLVNNKMKVIENGVTKEHLLNEEEYDESLVRYFNFNT